MPIAPFEIRRGEPGCRRNQLIVPRPGVVRADVEDDFHHFWVEIAHDGERVVALTAGAVRWPWTSCPQAGTYLAERMTGQPLHALASVDNPLLHCTHQYDLALLAAAHAHDTRPTLYSSFTSDETVPTRCAELYRNGCLLLAWEIAGSEVVSPGLGHGKSLRRLKVWAAALEPDQQEAARVLRRTVFVAEGRRYDFGPTSTADRVTESIGACFTFQPEHSAQAKLALQKRDFSSGGVPLRQRIEEVVINPG